MADRPITVHYVSSTHWDREWYQSFQGFRMRLVDVLDQIIEVLEAQPGYVRFCLDGQTAPIDDYLEIRPDMADRLRKLIVDRRLLVGPWYVQPDLMLVGGEGLIRNLLRGFRHARQWGAEPMKFGYMCDIFGLPSMMPQLLAGFGISAGLLGRGTNEDTHPGHFRWASADGSELLTFKLQDTGGYSAWWLQVRGPAGDDHFDPDKLTERAEAFVEKEHARDPKTPLVMAIDANDHQPIWTSAVEALETLRGRLGRYDWVHTDFETYGLAMAEHAAKLPVFAGELRTTCKNARGYGYLISHTLSSRVGLKQSSDRLLTLLTRWAEPLSVWATLRGAQIPPTYLPLAWRYLLLNHPHDSICGCSVDQVHRDMEYRFDQGRMIAEGVTARAAYALAGPPDHVPADRFGHLELRVFNPMPIARTETVELDVPIPTHWPEEFAELFGYETKPALVITDPAGRPVPWQLLSQYRNWRYHRPPASGVVGDRTEGRDAHMLRLAVTIDLPPLGLTTLAVRPAEGPTRNLGSMRTAPTAAENEHVALAIGPDGLVTLTDRATGRAFEGLLDIVDDAEIGDGWHHWAPTNAHELRGGRVEVGCVHDGPLSVRFVIDRELQVPACYDRQAQQRSDRRVAVRVRHELTLRAGQDYLEVKTRIDDPAEDHRLRLIVPTGGPAEEYFVDEPFGLIRRQTGIDTATGDWIEPDVPERSMWSLAGVWRREKGGLTLVAEAGLKEVAVLDDPAGTLAVTLMRAFGQTVGTVGEPGGQQNEPLTLRYLLKPLSGKLDPAGLLELRDRFQAGLHPAARHVAVDDAGNLPDWATLLAFDNPRVLLSSFKPAEDGDATILRVYNPGPESQKLTVHCAHRLVSAEAVNLDEQPDDRAGAVKLAGADHQVRLTLAAHEIRTVKLVWKKK